MLSRLICQLLEDRITPAILTVNSALDDVIGGNGQVTLREAIIAANNDTATDGGGTGSGADTIVFASSLNGQTITLNGTALPDISAGLMIQGPGANLLSISGNNQSRIVSIAPTTTAAISGLTLTQGKILQDFGGAIVNNGTLTLTNTTFVGNSAVQVAALGGSGGAIFNFFGTLTIIGSTFANNSASFDGGAINSTGTANIINSTLSGNTGGINGGAIRTTGTLTVTNSTIVRNRGGSGGGIFIEGGPTTLFNSIVAGNTNVAGDTPNDITGNFSVNNASVGNVIGDAATAGGLTNSPGINVVGNNGSGTLPIASIINVNLAFNGGTTQTHALAVGSPALSLAFDNKALDANGNPLTTDQRGIGFARSVISLDAGAFENQVPRPTLTVDNLGDIEDGNVGVGQLTLREALNLNNAPDVGVTTINFASSLNGKTITLGGTALPDISAGLTIQGPGANLLSISGNNQSRIVSIAPNTTVAISGLTLTQGKVLQDFGGAISNFGTLTLTNCTVVGNSAVQVAALGGSGGAIFNFFGTLTIIGSTFANNLASFDGGAIENTGTVNIINSTLSGNTGGIDGGAIRTTGTLTVTNSTIVRNRGGSGGGININLGTTTLFNSIVAGNTGAGDIPNDIAGFNSVNNASVGNVIGDAATAGGLTNSSGINVVGNNGSGTLPIASIINVNLAFNGGTTQTHALAVGSPALSLAFDNKALDANGNPLTTDQRGSGFARSVISLDAGAFENQAIAINPPVLVAGRVNIAYSQSLSAMGGMGPFVFAIANGTLPPGLALSATGSIVGTPTQAGTFNFTITSISATGDFASLATSITIVAAATNQFAVGSDLGSGTVKFFNPENTRRFTITPFGASFTGGIRTATADFNGDGIADVVVGTGPGRPTRVLVLDGVTQTELFAIDPFEASFTGGVFVAAGDINGDGRADLIITPDQGGGPRMHIFSGDGFVQIADFFGIDDPDFRGGARAAMGDINNDGRVDLIVAAGFGGGPRVAAFNGMLLTASGGPKLFGDFFAFEITLRDGTFITSGDINGDGFAELIAGGGPGGGPRVSAFDGQALLGETQTRISDFFAGDTSNRGGIRITTKDLNNDGIADLIAGAGTGAGSRVTTYSGVTLRGGMPPELSSFEAFPGLTNGVFVG